MTRVQLYDLICEISDALNTLQVIGEDTSEMDEDDEFPTEINDHIKETLQELEKRIY